MHPSNTTKRLGLPDLPAKKSTSAKKQADEKVLTDQQAVKTVKTKKEIEQMDMLKQKMETDQAAAIAPVKTVCPHPKPVRKGKALSVKKSNPVSVKLEGKAHLITNKWTWLNLPIY